MSSFVPAGSIVPYAGDNTSNLPGWAACNGASLNTGDYPDLFGTIGFSNGGSGSIFYLPDLRGRFLRGASSTRAPGSKASFTTHNPFTLSVQYMPSDYHVTDVGAVGPLSHGMVEWNPGNNLFNISGGDQETRPLNVYMNFIIKLNNAVPILVGSLVPYTGSDNSSGPDDTKYLFCDENSYKSVTYPDLSTVVGTRFQSTPRTGHFAVPQIDGQFIRGLDIPGGNDPDVSTRLAAPDGTKGSAVGTIQTYATSAKGLTVTINHYPPGSTNDVYPTSGHDNLYASNYISTLTFSAQGAKESRPNNANVTYYIKANTTSDSSDFPVGGIIAIPGTGTETPDTNYWAVCDGTLMTTSNNPALYTVLQTAWGGQSDGKRFNLPDLQGQFLRATDNHNSDDADTYGDPDRFLRLPSNPGGVTQGTGSKQNFMTALPQTPFTISGFSYPSNDHDNAAGAIGNNTSEYNSDSTTYNLTGGDTETAPISLAVIYYIKIA